MTPTVFRDGPYRFFFFSREETRMHVHVVSQDGEAKFWMEPDINLASNYGHSESQLRQVRSLIERHRDEIFSAWREHFGR